MAADKKKDSKALYEVISQRKKTLGVPGWFGPSEHGQAAQAPAPEVAAAQDAPPAETPRPRRVDSTLEEPVVSYKDGRLRISLNQVSSIVVAVGLVLLLTVTFLAGRKSGRLANAGDVRVAEASARDGGLESLKLTPVNGTAQVDPASSGGDARKKGMYYLVIQAGISTEGQAREIQSFLRSKGVRADIERDLTNKWMVIDEKPFDKKDSPEIADRKSKIEQLGKEYLKKGRYGFYQPYVRQED